MRKNRERQRKGIKLDWRNEMINLLQINHREKTKEKLEIKVRKERERDKIRLDK